MYDSLGLAALKEDAMEVGAAAVGTVAGLAVAKFVTSKLSGTGGLLRKAVAPTEAGASPYVFAGADKVATLVPVAVGVAIYSMGANKMGRGAARDAVAGAAAGMVAYGIGALVASFTKDSADTAKTFGISLGNVYDYSLNGDFGPGDVSAYMMNGAPVSFEPYRQMNGAPVDIQTVTAFNGAPTSATVLNTNAPISTALVA
jgi:hypothetical protein